MFFNVDLYIAASGGAKQSKGIGGYVVEVARIEGEPVTRAGFIGEENTSAQRLTLLSLREALRILVKPCKITLHIPDPFVRSAFKRKQVYIWGIMNGKKDDGTMVKNADLWLEVYRLIWKHAILVDDAGTHSYTGWIKSEAERVK